MVNHPNRSRKSSELRFVAYSLASHQALAEDKTIDALVDKISKPLPALIVFATHSRDRLSRFSNSRWPSDAKVIATSWT
jgi:hypothetical protein